MNQPGKTDAPAPSGPPQDAHPARRRRPSRWPYAVALVAALGVVGTAWLSRKHFEPIIAGVAAPSFTVSTMEGQPVGLDSYPGKVVLLNVWATWCVPCETEMPSMQRLLLQKMHLTQSLVRESLLLLLLLLPSRVRRVYVQSAPKVSLMLLHGSMAL